MRKRDMLPDSAEFSVPRPEISASESEEDEVLQLERAESEEE
jgi:hypothetical protein